MKLSDLIYLLIGLALLILIMGCAGPAPVRDVPYDYDTDEYACITITIMEVSNAY